MNYRDLYLKKKIKKWIINKRWIRGEKVIVKFFGLRAKTYSYLIDDGSKDIKAKGTIKCVIKRKLKFENYKNYTEKKSIP